MQHCYTMRSVARYVAFKIVEVAVPREVFKAILERTGRLRVPIVATGEPLQRNMAGKDRRQRQGLGHIRPDTNPGSQK